MISHAIEDGTDLSMYTDKAGREVLRDSNKKPSVCSRRWLMKKLLSVFVVQVILLIRATSIMTRRLGLFVAKENVIAFRDARKAFWSITGYHGCFMNVKINGNFTKDWC